MPAKTRIIIGAAEYLELLAAPERLDETELEGGLEITVGESPRVYWLPSAAYAEAEAILTKRETVKKDQAAADAATAAELERIEKANADYEHAVSLTESQRENPEGDAS